VGKWGMDKFGANIVRPMNRPSSIDSKYRMYKFRLSLLSIELRERDGWKGDFVREWDGKVSSPSLIGTDENVFRLAGDQELEANILR
jgi:hypothetical protein